MEECSDCCVPIGRKASEGVESSLALTAALALKAQQIKGDGTAGGGEIGSFQAYQSKQMRAEIMREAAAGRARISRLRGGF